MSGIMLRRETIDVDCPHLVLPDGRRANSLDRHSLRRELEALGVPGITAHIGVQEMLCLYDASEQSRIEAQRRANDLSRQKALDASVVSR